jgi:hypothetical protein
MLLEQETTETMWAIIVDKSKGLYKIDNVPFYASSLSSGDIIFAEYDEDESMLTYRNTVEYSGNSTIRIVGLDKSSNLSDLVTELQQMGCLIERMNDRYLAVEVPKEIAYHPIKTKLEELEKTELIGYEESCLSSCHSY